MKCPVCKEQMIVVEYHNIELDCCTNCHGTWFDNEELDLLFRSMEMNDAEGFVERLVIQPEAPSDEAKRRCPICKRKMKKQLIGSDPQVLVDCCPKNHGLWFDEGEVHHLVNSLNPGKIAEYNSEQELLVFLGEVFDAKKHN